MTSCDAEGPPMSPPPSDSLLVTVEFDAEPLPAKLELLQPASAKGTMDPAAQKAEDSPAIQSSQRTMALAVGENPSLLLSGLCL